MTHRCVVVGAGLAGATAAWELNHNGWHVEVHEAEATVGGNLRTAAFNGVPYEPHGPHIFHTSNLEAYRVMSGNVALNDYRHQVKTRPPGGPELSWPLQVSELKVLKQWPQIAAELDALSGHPEGANFEAYATSLMGRTLYELFCEGYTWKQWGQDPRTLSASFAPKRLDLRTDGDTSMFRDTWQGYAWRGWHHAVENLLRQVPVYLGSPLTLGTLPEADAYVVTAPLDQFLESGEELPWRGVRTEVTYHPDQNQVLSAPVVNEPSRDVPYTRQVETRQMAWSHFTSDPANRGTVVCREYPGASVKHYPVDDLEGRNRHLHGTLVTMLKMMEPRAVLAGRLASYAYLDMDQAIMQGLNAARKILRGTRK